MPDAWNQMLNASSISKAEQRLNPQAVLDVLNYYSASSALGGVAALGGVGDAHGAEGDGQETVVPAAHAPSDKFVSLEMQSARGQQFARPDETEVRVKSGSSSSEFETHVHVHTVTLAAGAQLQPPPPPPPSQQSQPPPLPAKVFGNLSASRSLGKLAAFASPRKKNDKAEKSEKKEKEKEKEREKEKEKKDKKKLKEQTKSIASASANDHNCLASSANSTANNTNRHSPQPSARTEENQSLAATAAGRKMPASVTSSSMSAGTNAISFVATRSVEVAVGGSGPQPCAPADTVPPLQPLDPTYQTNDEVLERTRPALPDVVPAPGPTPVHSHSHAHAHAHAHSDSSNSLAGSPDASASASATSSAAHASSAASLGSAHKKSSTSLNSAGSAPASRSASQSSGECLAPADEREPLSARSERDASPTPPPPVSTRPELTKSIVRFGFGLHCFFPSNPIVPSTGR